MKHFFGKLHLWLAVPFGLLITCICLSGALLVFENEIEGMVHPEFRHIDAVPATQPVPLGRLLESVSATLPDSVKITGVEISPEKDVPYKVNISKPRRASVIVNQYTGEVIGRSLKLTFFAEVTRLHRRFFDKAMTADGNPSFGKLMVGISTLVFVVVLLTGIFIWWPASRKAFAASMKFPLRKGAHRFWFWLHDACGMYAVVFLLAIALTGLTWSFKWYASGFYSLMGASADAPRGKGHGADMSKSGKKTDFTAWQKAFDEVASKNSARAITVTGKSVDVAVTGCGNHRAADTYKFNSNGKVTGCTLYSDTPLYDRARGWVYSIHAGLWGGIWSKILNFIVALIGAALPLTGYYLWIHRLNAAKRTSKE